MCRVHNVLFQRGEYPNNLGFAAPDRKKIGEHYEEGIGLGVFELGDVLATSLEELLSAEKDFFDSPLSK